MQTFKQVIGTTKQWKSPFAIIRRWNSTTPESSIFNASDNVKPIKSEDRSRVDMAMLTKEQEIRKNASNHYTSKQIFGHSASSVDFGENYNLPHPIWNKEYLVSVRPEHVPFRNLVDTAAFWTIKTMRFNFDWMSGWIFGKKTTEKALTRVIFLETVAGIPGSIAGIVRHLASLRRLRRDNGWIHTLLEEAENERMHLLTALELKKPGPIFKGFVWFLQGIFFNFYFAAYLISPIFCHRLVGYLEEQAVVTYTHILHEIDTPGSDLSVWKTSPAPEIAKTYWKLDKDATMRDVMLVIRADESHHHDVNHAFADLDVKSGVNPFPPGH